jgi:hypothetical protein
MFPARTAGIFRLRGFRLTNELVSEDAQRVLLEAAPPLSSPSSERIRMSKRGSEDESVRIAHLTMLQGIIGRMGANSFALKALSATFASAAVAVMAAATKPSVLYAISATIPIIIFWLMDAQYLRHERSYRRLYDKVRRGEEIETYTLDATPFMKDAGHVLRLAATWSVAPFYIVILLSLAGVAFATFREVPPPT